MNQCIAGRIQLHKGGEIGNAFEVVTITSSPRCLSNDGEDSRHHVSSSVESAESYFPGGCPVSSSSNRCFVELLGGAKPLVENGGLSTRAVRLADLSTVV